MTKLRKQRRKKTYKHNVNRKRLRNKIEGVGNIGCKEIKDAWDKGKSIQTNLSEMGLSHDPNRTLPILQQNPSKQSATIGNNWQEDAFDAKAIKSHVVESLEADARAPRKRLFRLPKGQVALITFLIDKYGKDYRAMTRDSRNFNQETWKQLRAKIKRFKGIPEQYGVYLRKRGLEADMEDDESVVSSDGEI